MIVTNSEVRSKNTLSPIISYCEKRLPHHLKRILPISAIKYETIPIGEKEKKAGLVEVGVIKAVLHDGDVEKNDDDKNDPEVSKLALLPNLNALPYTIRQLDADYIIELEACGLNADEIKITRSTPQKPNCFAVVISGEKPKTEDNQVVNNTRIFGKFEQNFEIPLKYYKSWRPSKKAENGVLNLTWEVDPDLTA